MLLVLALAGLATGAVVTRRHDSEPKSQEQAAAHGSPDATAPDGAGAPADGAAAPPSTTRVPVTQPTTTVPPDPTLPDACALFTTDDLLAATGHRYEAGEPTSNTDVDGNTRGCDWKANGEHGQLTFWVGHDVARRLDLSRENREIVYGRPVSMPGADQAFYNGVGVTVVRGDTMLTFAFIEDPLHTVPELLPTIESHL